jgi:hypothetical protein
MGLSRRRFSRVPLTYEKITVCRNADQAFPLFLGMVQRYTGILMTLQRQKALTSKLEGF